MLVHMVGDVDLSANFSQKWCPLTNTIYIFWWDQNFVQNECLENWEMKIIWLNFDDLIVGKFEDNYENLPVKTFLG